jgi:ABC-type multidrug transport system ATPase subunit
VSGVRLRGTTVAKRFGRIAALRGIDFEIAPGEAVAILGANGAGKSTLLRILAGLSRASGGVFEALRGTDTDTGSSDALPREELRGEVGYVGHATLLYGELSAEENLVFAGRLAGCKPTRKRVAELLDTVGLADVASRRAGTFSRGMSQRLAIARAIVHEPAVLLLDEPFTGLDEMSAERLSSQLAGLRSGGRSLVVVTHDPQRAVELSDRALILHHGEIVARPGRDSGSGDFDAAALRACLSTIASRTREAAA